jgi:hypothetical protein
MQLIGHKNLLNGKYNLKIAQTAKPLLLGAIINIGR